MFGRTRHRGTWGFFFFSPKTPTYPSATETPAEKDLIVIIFKYMYVAGGVKRGGLNHTTIYGLI